MILGGLMKNKDNSKESSIKIPPKRWKKIPRFSEERHRRSFRVRFSAMFGKKYLS